MDCGPTCLRMIAKYYGKSFDLLHMKNISRIKNEGSSLLDIVDTAKKMGIKSKGLKIDIDFIKWIDLPVILHWDCHHFVVLFKIRENTYFIADPAIGILKLNTSDFLSHWQNSESSDQKGIVLTVQL